MSAARPVGASSQSVRAAAAEESSRPDVAADRAAGIGRDVEGTPTAFVTDERLVGPSSEELRDAIETKR